MRKIVFFLLPLFSLLACGGKKSSADNPSVSLSAADDGGINFIAKNLDGQEVQLSAYRGKTVLLNIWATWCGPCKKEIPDLNIIHQNYKDKDVVVLGILLESGPLEQAKKVVADEFKIDYPTLYGDDKIARQFEVIGFPLTVIIDKNGNVRAKMLGQQTKERFVNALKDAGV